MLGRRSAGVLAALVICACSTADGNDGEASETQGSVSSGPESSGTEAEASTDTSTTTTTSTSTNGDGDGDGDGDGAGCSWPTTSAFTQRWEYQHDASGLSDNAGPIFVADDNSIYVAGRVNIEGLDGDAWVARISGEGELLWMQSPIGQPQTNLSDIAVDSAGRVVVVGTSFITDPAFGLTSQPFVAMLEDGGAELWRDSTPTDPPNPFFAISTVVIAGDESIWVGGTSGAAVSALRNYSAAGTIGAEILGDGARPSDMITADDGSLYIAGSDGTKPILERRDAMGMLTWSVDGPGPEATDFGTGTALRVALDPTGAPVIAGLSDYFIGNPMNPTEAWTNLWVQWFDTSGNALGEVEYDHNDFGQMGLAVDTDGRTAVAHRQMSGPPFVRTFDAARTLIVEQGLACPTAGMNMAAVESDFVFAGSIMGGEGDAFVTRIGD